jgi:hypothetical protein
MARCLRLIGDGASVGEPDTKGVDVGEARALGAEVCKVGGEMAGLGEGVRGAPAQPATKRADIKSRADLIWASYERRV